MSNQLYSLPRSSRRTRRSSLDVKEFKAHVNSILDSDWYTQEQKKAICDVLHEVLHATGNYNGFNYVYWLEKGYAQWKADGEPQDNSQYLGQEYDRRYY